MQSRFIEQLCSRMCRAISSEVATPCGFYGAVAQPGGTVLGCEYPVYYWRDGPSIKTVKSVAATRSMRSRTGRMASLESDQRGGAIRRPFDRGRHHSPLARSSTTAASCATLRPPDTSSHWRRDRERRDNWNDRWRRRRSPDRQSTPGTMIEDVMRRHVNGTPLILLLCAACATGGRQPPAAGGTITVGVTATGPSARSMVVGVTIEPAGVEGTVKGEAGVFTRSNIPPGEHVVRLGNVPASCRVDGGAERTVSIAARGSAVVRFSLQCR